jgi:hypothetical protein
MARQRLPIQPTELQAIKAAEAEWLRWRDIERSLPADIHDKQAITKLRVAANAMQDALNPFVQHGGSRQTAALVAAMQATELFRTHQAAYRQMLDDLIEPLQLIQKSTAPMVRRGPRAAENVGAWVRMVADSWVAIVKKSPTPKGRFYVAMTAVALHRSVPKVTPERVERALAEWRALRRFRAGNSGRIARSE